MHLDGHELNQLKFHKMFNSSMVQHLLARRVIISRLKQVINNLRFEMIFLLILLIIYSNRLTDGKYKVALFHSGHFASTFDVRSLTECAGHSIALKTAMRISQVSSSSAFSALMCSASDGLLVLRSAAVARPLSVRGSQSRYDTSVNALEWSSQLPPRFKLQLSFTLQFHRRLDLFITWMNKQ
jgi:hypothetical protein